MTVKQLINKLKKLPEDAKVITVNNNSYINGLYETKGIDYDEMGNYVIIDKDTDKKLFDEWD
ncbi:MAG: hypothetical protein J6Y02_06485 [Pseudobutyrivibrio sp.]|nr:hypothetical protein [Pseudobutyrivibrio sp.]